MRLSDCFPLRRFERFIFLIAGTYFCAASLCFAAEQDESGDDAAKPPRIDEDLAESDDTGSDYEPELSFSSHELREKAQNGFALGIGPSEAWQTFSFYAEFYKSPRFLWTASLGTGTYYFKDSYQSRDYKMKVQSRAFNGGLRYFLSEFFPVYTQTSLGYAFWRIDSKPTGASTGELSEVSVDERLRYAGSLHGLWLGQQLGMQYLWGSGVSIDVSLVGFAKSFVLAEDYTRSSSASKHIAKKKVEAPLSWGLLNMKLGYWF